MNKLIAVVWKSESYPFIFDTVMEDRTGVRRKIGIKVYNKHKQIPDDWWSTVIGESEFQLTEELKREKGMGFPDEF